MKKKSYAEIIQIWKKIEQSSLAWFTSSRSKDCLTFGQFDQYVRGKYRPEQQQHVENCAWCQRMVRHFSKYAGEIVPLSERTHWWSSVLKDLQKITRKFKAGFFHIWTPIPLPVRYAVSIAVVMIIMLSILSQPEKMYSHLARIEPVYYQPIAIRGEPTLCETDRLFQRGMSFYKQQKYPSAIEQLSQAVEIQADNAELNFYLGLCYLLDQQTNHAIRQLQITQKLTRNVLLEKSYWYSGNAYLLQEDAKQALEMFRKVVEMEGDYEWEAREIISNIRKIASLSHE